VLRGEQDLDRAGLPKVEYLRMSTENAGYRRLPCTFASQRAHRPVFEPEGFLEDSLVTAVLGKAVVTGFRSAPGRQTSGPRAVVGQRDLQPVLARLVEVHGNHAPVPQTVPGITYSPQNRTKSWGTKSGCLNHPASGFSLWRHGIPRRAAPCLRPRACRRSWRALRGQIQRLGESVREPAGNSERGHGRDRNNRWDSGTRRTRSPRFPCHVVL